MLTAQQLVSPVIRIPAERLAAVPKVNCSRSQRQKRIGLATGAKFAQGHESAVQLGDMVTKTLALSRTRVRHQSSHSRYLIQVHGMHSRSPEAPRPGTRSSHNVVHVAHRQLPGSLALLSATRQNANGPQGTTAEPETEISPGQEGRPVTRTISQSVAGSGPAKGVRTAARSGEVGNLPRSE